MAHSIENSLWVSAEGSDEELGTFDHPYSDIADALERVQPGHSILLKSGTYPGSVSIQVSGTQDHPIRIAAADGAKVVVDAASWFLYDVSDCIIEGITFSGAAASALSVIGACERNRFAHLSFVNCGAPGAASCSLFFGGTGASCNLVETCTFTREAPAAKLDQAVTAIMIAEGDSDGGKPNLDFIIRNCTISGYDFGILAGTRDATANQYGHVLEYNRIAQSGAIGIAVRCGDTIVRGNTITGARDTAVAIYAGESTMVEDNRIADCGTGIKLCSISHTLHNNCIVRCANAVHLAGAIRPDIRPAGSVLIQGNTLVDCTVGFDSDPGTTSVAERNLVYGNAAPCRSLEMVHDLSVDVPTGRGGSRLYAQDNRIIGFDGTVGGFSAGEVEFASYDTDNFTNTSGYGADGWVLTPVPFDPPPFAEVLKSWEDADDEDAVVDDDDDDAEASAEAANSKKVDAAGFDLEGFFAPGDDFDESFGKPHVN